MSEKNKFYVIRVYQGVEPDIVSGPIDNYDDLVGEAKDFYHSEEYDNDYDNIFVLAIDENGVPSVDSFSNLELEDEE